MSPTERILLGHKAWRLAARLLQGRCLRLQHRLDTQDQTPGRILASEVDRLQAEGERRLRHVRRERRQDQRRRLRDLDIITHLQAAIDSANACCNRIQADGNALADQLHAWRQACQDHGIEATPEALRAVLRRVDAGCVAEAPRCLDCGRSAEQVDGRWRPRCWCVGFADELAEADL